MGISEEFSRITLLIADDEPSLLEPLVMEFEAWRFHVLTAQDGEQAWKLIESGRVDAVLSDVRMPSINGIDLLRKVRARFPHLPFTLMTAYTEIAEEVAVSSGASRVFQKPFDLRELSEWVRCTINTARLSSHPRSPACTVSPSLPPTRH